MNLKRLPAIAFGVLALATVGAFFVIQHLKTAKPPIWGSPQPIPGAIHPVSGRTCISSANPPVPIDYSRAELPIAVSRAETVGVYVVSEKNASGSPVATVSNGTPLRMSVLGSRTIWYPHNFVWDGRFADGRVAPDGTYFFRISMLQEGQTINLTDSPVQVVTAPPRARVLGVSVIGQTGRTTGPAVLTPHRGAVRISYTPGHYRRVWIDIYRTDVAGKPQLVWHHKADPKRHTAVWNGVVHGHPVPAGTYLAGITAQNLACDQASWPVVMPPTAGTTPHAGITIRYLTVTPPLTPTVSGSSADVTVDAPQTSFTWEMHRAGTARELEHGGGAAGDTQIHVPMPRHTAGLYTLVVHSGTQSAAVPLVASKAGPEAGKARVLVVLPMLSWIGNSPVDDTGDGLPSTLSAGDAVSLDRPLVGGPPASVADSAALLKFLDSMHRSYQLTTDVALAEGQGPSLVDRWGVLLPDGSDVLPASLASSGLPGFVRGGGRVLALGAGTLGGASMLSGFPSAPQATAPTLSRTDPFGAQHGPLTPTGGALITVLTDALNLFGNTVAFSGFSHYTPIEPPAGVHVSAAGIANGSPAIVGFPLGSGTVIEVGLPDFGASLTHNVDSQGLLNNIWHLLARN